MYLIGENRGVEFFYRNSKDLAVSGSVITEREYALSSPQIPQNPIVIDVGAHAGYFSLWAEKEYSGVKILAVEPLEENQDLLKLNLSRLSSSVRIVKGVVGAPSDEVDILCRKDGDFVGYIDFQRGAYQKADVIVQRVKNYSLRDLLDFCIEGFGSDQVFCLKLDCEGGEYEFLGSANKEDLKKIQWIVGEYHNTLIFQMLLERAGFRLLKSTPSLAQNAEKTGLFLFQQI